MMFFNPEYFLFMLPALALMLIAQFWVKSAYGKYGQIPNSRRMSGRDAAASVLLSHGVTGVRVESVGGNLTDHYDPRTKVIYLSEGVFHGMSIAAVGIAAHEAGHAVQDARSYSPLRLRNAIIPACNLGTTIGFPLMFIGYFLQFSFLLYIGILLFSLAFVFQLVTLPVEFNASSRALRTIRENGLLAGDEYTGAKRMLTAAAMTYVAAMIQTLTTLLFYLLQAGRRR